MEVTHYTYTTYFTMFVCILIIVVNGGTLVILLAQRNMRRVLCHFYLASLAVADILCDEYLYVGDGDLTVPLCQNHHGSCMERPCGEYKWEPLCFCSPLCHFFNDCCVGSLSTSTCYDVTSFDRITANIESNGYLPSDFSCVDPVYNEAPSWGIQMVTTCKATFNDKEVVRRCLDIRQNDTYASTPVTDGQGFTFRNVYCALCNYRDTSDVTSWGADYSCDFGNGPDTYSWNISQVVEHVKSQCEVKYTPPFNQIIDGELSFRDCLNIRPSHLIDETRCQFSHPAYDECSDYTAYIQVSSSESEVLFFKNPHCLMCFHNLTSLNGSTYQNLICDNHNFPGYGKWSMVSLYPEGGTGFATIPLSILFDFRSSSEVQIMAGFLQFVTHEGSFECSIGQAYDPFQRRCRQLICPPGMRLNGNECVYNSHTNTTNVECDTSGQINATMLIESQHHDEFGMKNTSSCSYSLEKILGEQHTLVKTQASRLIAANNSERIVSSVIVATEDIKMLEDNVDRHIAALTSSTEENKRCNVSEIQLHFVCNSSAIADDCSGEWHIEDISSDGLDRHLTYDIDHDFQVNLSSQNVLLQIKYTRTGEGYFNKSILIKRCVMKARHASLECPLVSFPISFFRSSPTGDGWLEFIPTEDLFSPDKYIKPSADEIQICSDNTIGNHPVFKPSVVSHSSAQKNITLVGIILSLIGCSITFFTICFFRTLRNRVSPLLLNFIVAVFLAQLLFISGGDQTQHPEVCAIIAIFLHYFWLSTFSWMNILAFDLFLTFGSPDNLNAPRQLETKQLIWYPIFGWGFPLCAVIPTIVLHYCQCTIVRYGSEAACWISNGWANLLCFGMPAAVMLSANVIFYIGVVWGIHSSSATNDVNNANIQAARAHGRKRVKHLVIYAKISILMGFTWIFGYIASFTDNDALWYVFIICNSSQGFLVFLTNTCNRRVYQCYKNRICGHGNRVEPAGAKMPHHPPRQHGQAFAPPNLPIEKDGGSLVNGLHAEVQERLERSGVKESEYQAWHKFIKTESKPVEPQQFDPDLTRPHSKNFIRITPPSDFEKQNEGVKIQDERVGASSLLDDDDDKDDKINIKYDDAKIFTSVINVSNDTGYGSGSRNTMTVSEISSNHIPVISDIDCRAKHALKEDEIRAIQK
ncbi:uncharacterized protein [Amphiura filiformis]|uniref:uncharacterized protein n=1 Tax=Amphiura filiformis TaxID=82378 RepID=UPI003B213F0B